MKKELTVLISALILCSIAAAEISVTPGESNIIDSNISETSINSSNPLDAEITDEGLEVSPELSTAPGPLNLNVVFSNSSSTYDLTVEEVSNWSVSPEKVDREVDLGSSGTIELFNISADGNVGADLNVESSGEAFDFIEGLDSISVRNKREVVSSYSVRSGVEPGSYSGEFNFSGMDQGQVVDVNLSLVDSSDPVIEEINFSDYMSGVGGNFSVKASDNSNVSEVRASVERRESVNGSEEWSSFQDFRFNSVPNSDLFELDSGIERPGRYRADVFVEDSAGNSVNESVNFSVSELDALSIDNSETLVLPVHRKGSEISESIGEISPGTDVEITLESFSQDLDEEDWEIAVLSDEEGPQYFNSVNDSVSLEREANLSLTIDSDVETEFNGVLGFDGLQYHEDVDDLSFSGEYLDCPVPQREEYEVLQRNVTLNPVDSHQCEDAGWEISYFAPADSVPNNEELDQSISILTPNELKEEQRMIQEQIISEKESSIAFWQSLSVLFLFGTGVSVYGALFAVYQLPYMLHFDINRSERLRKILKRREKLGV